MAIGLSCLCYFASLIISSRYLRVRAFIALAAAALLTFPNNLFYKAGVGHTNFFTLYYVPCIALIFLWACEDFPRVTLRSTAGAALAAFLFGLLFATGYYAAWMFGLTIFIAACAAGWLLRRDIPPYFRGHRRPIASLTLAAAVGFGLGLIPFLAIYLPALTIAPPRSYPQVIALAPTPIDLINVSRWNLVWGWLVERVQSDPNTERAMAVTPGIAASFLVLTLWIIGRTRVQGAMKSQAVFAIACAAVFLGSWLLTARIARVSAFWVLYQIVPGAGAIRASGRVQLVVHQWVVFGLAALLEQWIASASTAKRARTVLLSAALLVFAFVEQISLFNTTLPRAQELARLAQVPRPPLECRAFFLEPNQENAIRLGQDAMWIALATGVPTLNGALGYAPPGWRSVVAGPDYHATMREWIERTRLREQVCIYDPDQRRWSLFR
jgi:hypothetical protein